MSFAPPGRPARAHARLRSRGARGMPVVVLLALSFGGSQPAPMTPPSGTWVITRVNAELLEAMSPMVAAAFFDGPGTIALGGYRGRDPGHGWASLAAFEADVEAGLVPDEVRIVMYDPEAWEHTPIAEQRLVAGLSGADDATSEPGDGAGCRLPQAR